MIEIEVLFFARAREIAGSRRAVVALREGATVDVAVAQIAENYPQLADVLPNCRFAVNEEFANGSHRLEEKSTLAVIPPVSGG
jgi:molybdopterin converting factor subunit 1